MIDRDVFLVVWSLLFLSVSYAIAYNLGVDIGYKASKIKKEKWTKLAFEAGWNAMQIKKDKVHIYMGSSEFVLKALINEVDSNLFSVERRKN